jgi:hypothetical protein
MPYRGQYDKAYLAAIRHLAYAGLACTMPETGTVAPTRTVQRKNERLHTSATVTEALSHSPTSLVPCHPWASVFRSWSSVSPQRGPAWIRHETRAYTSFAHAEVGETAALVRDTANVLENPGLGLYGAIIVGPRGAPLPASGHG